MNVQLRWSSLFSKSSWIKTTTSGLSYELGVNGEKKLMGTGILLIKMDIAHFTVVNSKPGNFNSVIWIILWHYYLEIDWRWESVPKKSVMVFNIFQMLCRASPWSSWTTRADIVVVTWVKNCTAKFHNHSIGMRSYLLKSNFKLNLQKHHFVYMFWSKIKCYLNFITCLYFLLALIRWNSSHNHLMELFKSKENCKEKFDSNNNWKSVWPRMIL